MLSAYDRIVTNLQSQMDTGEPIPSAICSASDHLLMPAQRSCACGFRKRPEVQYHPRHLPGLEAACSACRLLDAYAELVLDVEMEKAELGAQFGLSSEQMGQLFDQLITSGFWSSHRLQRLNQLFKKTVLDSECYPLLSDDMVARAERVTEVFRLHDHGSHRDGPCPGCDAKEHGGVETQCLNCEGTGFNSSGQSSCSTCHGWSTVIWLPSLVMAKVTV